MFQSPGEIAFTLGNMDIHWYGICMSLSMLCGLFVIFLVRNKYFKEISTDIICDLSFFLIIWGLISARLYYVIVDYKYFAHHPFEIIAIWNGGISIQGAILGGVLAGLYYCKKYKLNFLQYADLFSFGIVTGQIIGRLGNFFNSEAFGLPTNLPWKLYIPYKARPVEYRMEEFFHPTFLYESLLSLFILLILYFLITKFAAHKNGLIFCSYIMLYSVSRFIVETIRIDSVLNFGSIHIAHITSVIFFVLALLSFIYLFKKKSN